MAGQVWAFSMYNENPTMPRSSVQKAESAAGAVAAVWLQVVGIVSGTVVNDILHASPIVVLLPLPRTRIVRLTAAVLGLMWILLLACMTLTIYNSLILGWRFSGPRLSYTWLAPIMAAFSGVWAALNISLFRPTTRWLSRLVVGGIMISIPLAMTYPFLTAAFEIPGQRSEQGKYIWAVVLAIEVFVLLTVPWVLAILLTGFKKAELTRRVVLWQIGFLVVFLVCMVAGLLPVFNR